MAVDWAIYERFTVYAESVRKTELKRGYKETLFPRILVTLSGLLLIAFSANQPSHSPEFLWIGLLLFVGSAAYSVIAIFKRNGS